MLNKLGLALGILMLMTGSTFIGLYVGHINGEMDARSGPHAMVMIEENGTVSLGHIEPRECTAEEIFLHEKQVVCRNAGGGIVVAGWIFDGRSGARKDRK